MLNNLKILPWWLCTQDADSKRGWAATTLINSSLTPGFIPAPFNKTTEKPLLKKPTLDSAEIQNYRPLSLHSSLSKTLKCAIYNPLLTPLTLLTVTESLRAARASSHSSVLILLDPSSAFDTVNHQILFSTPTELSCLCSNLVTSYLTNCTF